MGLKGLALGILIVASAASVLTTSGAIAQFGNSNDNFVPLPTAQQPAEANIGVIGADVIHSLGQPLLGTSDAQTRLKSVKTLEEFTKQKSDAIGPREPQALDILAAAYSRETDAAVKIAIIGAVAEFSIPEAAELLNRAMEDGDSAVRKAAQHAKTRRDIRMTFARCCE
jgi:hypothetical protein